MTQLKFHIFSFPRFCWVSTLWNITFLFANSALSLFHLLLKLRICCQKGQIVQCTYSDTLKRYKKNKIKFPAKLCRLSIENLHHRTVSFQKSHQTIWKMIQNRRECGEVQWEVCREEMKGASYIITISSKINQSVEFLQLY